MTPAVQSPLELKARSQALAGGPTAPSLRFVLAELDAARAEIDRLEALTLEQARRKTLGGVPPGYHLPGAWKPGTLPGGVHVDYSDLARKTP